MFIFSKGKPKTFNLIKIDCIHAGRNNPMGTFRHTGEETQKSHTPKNVSKNKIKGNIWFYQIGNNKTTKDKIAFKHPAIFPDQLVLDHIITWSNEDDIILDSMCGSGTVAKMAFLNNRKFIGIDTSEEYINEICIPRLEMHGWINENLIDNCNSNNH